MPCPLNVASWDRILRAVIGIVLIALPVAGLPWWVAILGAAALVTSVAGFCPAYWLARVSTRKDAPGTHSESHP